MLWPKGEAAVLASPEDAQRTLREGPFYRLLCIFHKAAPTSWLRPHRLMPPQQLPWKKESEASRLANTWKPWGILEGKKALRYPSRRDNFGRSTWKGRKLSNNEALTAVNTCFSHPLSTRVMDLTKEPTPHFADLHSSYQGSWAGWKTASQLHSLKPSGYKTGKV